MGWLQRLFGMEKPADAQTNPAPAGSAPDGGEIPPERVGLNGEYDQSGLAKRVALAFDQDQELTDYDRLWVAQTGGTVVLKGEVPSQDVLNKMVSVARSVSGATSVSTDQVKVG
ncbi:BON domain-containing protein [Planktothrix sp. FACHB-1355]|uniref:BON domain-containing protein n=1 Tax=Aerosakkonema funiforme FACHB-1375 TaxID=2949571 RepID=A0A926VBS6_9CYAN|nr:MULTISPECIES: BON domain-containing protein [Oscillatoriales]MBD2180964.1 BON domain-containing protein [Aerosakkonema funiforme FACHB-1375]MBD3557795.1 BON domain-containing protein [Planktothrix sp. FACHB-1355]